jgi:hypothetical protein
MKDKKYNPLWYYQDAAGFNRRHGVAMYIYKLIKRLWCKHKNTHNFWPSKRHKCWVARCPYCGIIVQKNNSNGIPLYTRPTH